VFQFRILQRKNFSSEYFLYSNSWAGSSGIWVFDRMCSRPKGSYKG